MWLYPHRHRRRGAPERPRPRAGVYAPAVRAWTSAMTTSRSPGILRTKRRSTPTSSRRMNARSKSSAQPRLDSIASGGGGRAHARCRALRANVPAAHPAMRSENSPSTRTPMRNGRPRDFRTESKASTCSMSRAPPPERCTSRPPRRHRRVHRGVLRAGVHVPQRAGPPRRRRLRASATRSARGLQEISTTCSDKYRDRTSDELFAGLEFNRVGDAWAVTDESYSEAVQHMFWLY